MVRKDERKFYSKEISTPVGRLKLVCSERAITAVLWEDERQGRVQLPKQLKSAIDHPLLNNAEQQLAEYFEGRRQVFDLPLEPWGTPFQQNAWKILMQIPYGHTFSYQEQAGRLGSVKKARAVGAANGKNPISIIVPCHRVIGKDGKLTGFAGGIKVKHELLQFEASQIQKSGSA